MSELSIYEKDPTIYLFTSLTAGSSHIITATSRIETILKANKIPFKGVDTATDDLARKLFQRRASGKKLPLLVKEGYVLGGIEEVEEWNEYDELREALGVTTAFTPMPAKPTSLFEPTPSKTPPPLEMKLPGGFSSTALPGGFSSTTIQERENMSFMSPEQSLSIRQLGAEAAKAAAAKKPTPVKISSTNPLLAEKAHQSIGGVISRSTALPQSPTFASGSAPQSIGDILSSRSNIPKVEQKPVHIDAANPALSAGPISTAQKANTGETAKVEEEKVEQKTAAPDKSSEDDDENKRDEKDEEEEDTHVVETQKQDPQDASKAGVSVKE